MLWSWIRFPAETQVFLCLILIASQVFCDFSSFSTFWIYYERWKSGGGTAGVITAGDDSQAYSAASAGPGEVS